MSEIQELRDELSQTQRDLSEAKDDLVRAQQVTPAQPVKPSVPLKPANQSGRDLGLGKKEYYSCLSLCDQGNQANRYFAGL